MRTKLTSGRISAFQDILLLLLIIITFTIISITVINTDDNHSNTTRERDKNEYLQHSSTFFQRGRNTLVVLL